MSYQRRLSDVTIGLIIISFDLVTRMTIKCMPCISPLELYHCNELQLQQSALALKD